MRSEFSGIYKAKRALVTGHTGFKGSWLAFWLADLGAQVVGASLDPETSPNHWSLLDLDVEDRRVDIRDGALVSRLVSDVQPEIVFHCAAQPLVRRSYVDPVDTWSTNVLGTANVLDAVRRTEGVKAVVVVTSDKCYENYSWSRGYHEADRLGGHDPYSASKAAAELVTQSYRRSYFSSPGAALVATVRAGNVIGGGDWSEDRLIPDVVRARKSNGRVEIRSPGATRPWQHVLDCLSGYLTLGMRLLQGDAACAESWNFGPNIDANRSVTDVLTILCKQWPQVSWHVTTQSQPVEASALYLDCAKARKQLDWRPVWNLVRTIEETASWYEAFLAHRQVLTKTQLAAFIDDAHRAGLCWTLPR